MKNPSRSSDSTVSSPKRNRRNHSRGVMTALPYAATRSPMKRFPSPLAGERKGKLERENETARRQSSHLALHVEFQHLSRGDGAGTEFVGYSHHLVHEVVVMAGVVVEQHQLLHLGRIGQAHALLPGGMAPSDVFREFLVGVGRIVDEEIGAAHQLEDQRIERAWLVLAVGDVAQGAAVIFDPIAGRAVWMVERRGADRDLRPRMQDF